MSKQDHKRWRKKFNADCLKRDGYKCVFCHETQNLDVHHITDRHEMLNGGYVMSNGITVCDYHHILCEEYHISGECCEGFCPDDLYKKIGSSRQQAEDDSELLWTI